MACIRKHSLQIPLSKDELDCMRDSSYQQSASGFDDSSSNIPLSGRGIKSETRASSNLLKTALANRIQPRLPQSDQQLKDRSFNGVETYLRSQQPNGFLQGNRRQITTPQRESRLPPPSAISYNLSRVSRTTSESAVPISSILERRDSSQSDSSRGSNVPKSVTFNDKVEINEIERKYDDEGMDSINPHFEFINETLLNNGGKMQTEKNNESLNPMRNLLQPIREGLRSSPSLNLDLVYDETRERPDWMSDEEWMMLQSMYVPSRETSKDPSPPLRLPTVEDYPKQEVADELAAPSPPPLPDPSTFIPIPLKVEEDQVDLDPANNSSGGRLVNEERKCFEDREIQAKPPANQILNLDSLPVSLAFSNPTISQRSPMSPQTSRSPLGFSKVGVQNSNSENDALSCAQQLPQPPLRSSSSPLRSPQMSSLKSTLTKPSAPSLPRSPSTNSSVTPPSSKIFASRAFSPANRAFSASRSSPSSPTREVHQQPLSRQMPGSLNRLETQDSAFLSNTRQTRYLGTNQNMLVYPHSEGPSTSQNLLKNSTNSSNINTLNSHSYQSIDSSNDPVNRTTTSPSSLSVSPTGRYNSLNSPTRSLPNSKDPIGSGHEQRSSPLSINAINSPSTNSSPVRRPTHLPPMPKPVGMTRPAQSKPKLKSPLDLATSFYDNVDAEQQIQFQHKFLQQFGRHPAPIASPEEAARLNRKNSLDSNFSSDSRESVVSATSLKAEARIRRFFNY
ncbi:unnamed protein product [Bursaphelenchus xylophilus]|uniref:(pine wood nematode) hypothetical protein n=1 Tax=Bursaphelenchus xylophilus TaxID=6326 RepID=A0A1I7SF82_BURXY|nr:unnamed protein product [Bursaphelenchus xylophilus]CAG9130478.1 unnamed protein product [Bursaphelenchus xylophilus]